MEILKASFTLIFWFLTVTVCWQVDHATSFFGGAWCPYKREKYVPCRVHNGTETYLGPNICWRNLNGTISCTKRMLVRPKFVNSYKRIVETVYVPNCHQECFNCSTIHLLENRLGYLEKKINQVLSTQLREDDKTYGSGHTYIKNSISDDDDRDFDTLNVISDLRGLETRLANVETQLGKLIHSIKEEFLKLKSTTSTTTDSSIVSTQPEEEGEKAQEYSQVPIITTAKTTTTTITYSMNTPVDKLTMPRSRGLDSHHHHQTAIRLLQSKESNLERGDIASTLNDDGDEGEVSATSNEEYADQLYAHEYT